MFPFIQRWFWSPPPSDDSPSSRLSPVTPSLDQTRSVRVTMGRCSVKHPTTGHCNCEQGTSVGNNDNFPFCDYCYHPMAFHEDYDGAEIPPRSSKRFTPPPGIPSRAEPPFSSPLDSDICPRTDTVSGLARLLDEMHVVHVRGTPSTGKTTLASLLYLHCRERGDRVVFVPYWVDNSNPHWFLTQMCKLAGYEDVDEKSLLSTKTTFIIDEAQSSYSDTLLWLQIIKYQSSRHSGPKICLFASYGSPSTGNPTSGKQNMPFRSTPVKLGPSQRVSLMVSRVPNTPDICLFYNLKEFCDALERLSSRAWSNCEFTSDAGRYLYSMTNGHPGAVASLMSYVYKTYRSRLQKGEIGQITKQHIVDSLDDEKVVFEDIQSTPVFRSFPSTGDLTMPVAKFLQEVLQNKVVPCILEDQGVKLCFEMGWVHSDATDQNGTHVVCFLPSKLHQKFVEYVLPLQFQSKPFPVHQFPTITLFCEAVLRKFSRKNLCSISASGVPPEAQFQKEWYRAFYSLVGHGVAVSSEWSSASDGRIDFRVNDPAWGIELLRDGDRLSDHCNRFNPQGTYYRWIEKGFLRDWLVLDCRHSHPQRFHVRGTKLWRVVFRNDYSSAVVLGCENETLVPEFPLLD